MNLLPIITFATTCMGRAHHLIQTLPENIANTTRPNVEFLVLDYNSKDGLETHAKNKWMRWIGTAVHYYRIGSPKFYYPSHAKNMAALLSTGDIVVNLDADQYITEQLPYQIHSKLVSPSHFGIPKMPSVDDNKYGDFKGLLSFYKKSFLILGGYNEEMRFGWGQEDWDLQNRARQLNFTPVEIILDGRFISHSNQDRYANTPKRLNQSQKRHRQIHLAAMREGHFIANKGKTIGAGKVVKNFSKELEAGYLIFGG